MSEPTSIRAGDSTSWTRTVPGIRPVDGWVLKYRLLWPSDTAVDITATADADGDNFVVNLPAMDTASYPSGQATLVAWIERGTEVVTLDQQTITILPNLRAAATYDGRTPNERALDDARAALRAYLANGQAHVEHYWIGDRRMQFRTVKDITDLIASLEREVKRERAALALLNGGGVPGRVYTRM